MPADLRHVTRFCDALTNRREVPDFSDARNGLQHRGRPRVRKVGAAVDAGTEVFKAAAKRGVDFLIVHHGIHWKPVSPARTVASARKAALRRSGLSLYSSHLPLDAHPVIGNNALIAADLGLRVIDWFVDYEGLPIACVCRGIPRATLRRRLKASYPGTFKAIEFGSARPSRIAILSGSGRSALPCLRDAGCDTLITGELREEHFNEAHEQRWNLYPCGHYATETWGVKALAAAVSAEFGVPWEFIGTGNPL
ncbi:MAG: Nif3-like dinuclear metal center hexameric protein [Opitutia bacterium]|jgi:dinuclear metal center YbgI/SA1388 family protein